MQIRYKFDEVSFIKIKAKIQFLNTVDVNPYIMIKS